ncbi:glycoside hydrolase family 5 protein (plasmid) [Deinococcus sp. KNUC1210]|uniref:glycoside hydrolase family 5 protein n=1 Tax=Deinococcus sp. KNUC1210 TaxID=2917691 RepID=UPI001EF06B1C|nr:glycoside hydrolase family 5 protein [Deinococcus sp. KNUC1210]ULH17748.1 glycoside hydrolase family 5 protein [Deinococcus sp. KNUC1210]
MWLPDDPGQPRPMEDFARDAVTSGYRRGYEELAYALYSGDSTGLPSYYQEGALSDAHLVTQQTRLAEFADWDHQLTLHFYAPDGATVSFTDQYWYAQGEDEGKRLTIPRLARRTVDVVMALDDGNWRVHHWRVLADTPAQADRISFPDLAGQLARIRGVNYEARSAPFAALWTSLNADEVESDFARIHGLGLNTVRVFVPYPLPADAPNTLKALLDAAGRHELKVIPTLLDGYTAYRLADLPRILTMLETLQPQLSRPEVLAVDLKNEADLDAGKADWTRLRFVLGLLADQTRTLSRKAVTVGLIVPDAALAQHLDFVTVHSYAAPGQTATLLQSAKKLQRPVLLEEFGYHTQANKLPDPHTEADQAWHYRQTLDLSARERVGWLAWTLFDLPKGAVPGNRPVERHLGMLRGDGTEKPAALVVMGGRPAPPDGLTG